MRDNALALFPPRTGCGKVMARSGNNLGLTGEPSMAPRVECSRPFAEQRAQWMSISLLRPACVQIGDLIAGCVCEEPIPSLLAREYVLKAIVEHRSAGRGTPVNQQE